MSGDDDLLARLNALRPSSVQLKQSAASIDVETSEPKSVEDRLADRLKSLREFGGPAKFSSSNKRIQSDAENLTSLVKDEITVEQDPIRQWQQHGEDDQTLDELLADLGPDSQWKLDPDDPKNVESLMKEAREALPKNSGNVVAESKTEDPVERTEAPDSDQNGALDSKKTDDQRDEEDADDYIQRVLAELEVEKKHGIENESEPQDEEEQHASTGEDLELPSAPSKLPEPPPTSDPAPPSYEDSELEARFSKLGLGGLNLPSTPTAKPSSSKPKVTAQLKPKSNLPTYTDEDIDSWCCICNEDAEVKCIGCDGDLYCQNCWADGHGTGPGQERGHKAVQYNRKPPPAAA